MAMFSSGGRAGRRQQQLLVQQQQRHLGRRFRAIRFSSSRKAFRYIIISLAFIALLPPVFFHFKLKRFHQIKDLPASQSTWKSREPVIPTIEDALKLISGAVRQVILDAKVGPPLYEKGLAKDILSVVEKTQCKNCVVWAKSDTLVREINKLSADVMVGYVVMIDPSSGVRTNLLRMRGASVVGVYHPLVDEKLVRILHGRNKKVFAWTVDDAESMEKMLFERVDAVVTSDPSLLQRLMQDSRTQCLEEGFSLKA